MSSVQPIPFKANRQIPSYNVAIGASSQQSAAFGGQTYALRLVGTGACHYRVGKGSQTAVATDSLLSANQFPEYIGVNPGEQIAVIQDGSSTGNLNITELTR